jgi:hypothetical protein
MPPAFSTVTEGPMPQPLTPLSLRDGVFCFWDILKKPEICFDFRYSVQHQGIYD